MTCSLVQRIPKFYPAANEIIIEKITRYIALILHWNTKIRLVGFQNSQDLFEQGIADALLALPQIPDHGNLLDVGTGAGLPGMVFAILRPQQKIILVDSNAKKTSFLWKAKADLQLTNVEIHCARAETLKLTESPAMIIAKAFADLSSYLETIQPIVVENTTIFALKGPQYYQELAAIPEGFVCEKVVDLTHLDLKQSTYLLQLRGLQNRHVD